MIEILFEGKPINLEDPVFVQLINCVTVQDRMRFVAEHGEFVGDPPFVAGAAARVAVAAADRLREAADYLLASGEEGRAPGDAGTRTQFLRMTSLLLLQGVSIQPKLEMREGAARFVLEAANLAGFMALELTSAVEVGARTKRCERCNKLFLHGPLTGRRSHAKYCANRCRVAAMRARNASIGDKA